ncbi:hypothetical protein KY336_04150 [Candidatus Woesearchaeota archaeon]|nr:hypothetical protein [Candidatus Woesearchaeota archaeon]
MEYDEDSFEDENFDEKLAHDEIDGAEEGFLRGYEETADKDEKGMETEEDFDLDLDDED